MLVLAFFIVLPALVPLISCGLAGLIRREEGYWKKQRFHLIAIYAAAVLLGAYFLVRHDKELAIVAYATLVSVSAVLFWLPQDRNQTRIRGLCTVCGYDLRAHHPGDKCPECGTVKEC